MRIELKPCPFCGSEDLDIESGYDHAYVICERCETEGPAISNGSALEACEAWNTRHCESPQLDLDLDDTEEQIRQEDC
jgi:Lar family restriction alleviation protein